MVALALERQHGVDDVLEHARPGEAAVLGDVTDEHDRRRRAAWPRPRAAGRTPRTWTTEPGGEPSAGSAMVWMLSTTTSAGQTSSMAATMSGSDVSASSHRSGRTAPSRSARRRTCWALSSALTYSVVPGHHASSCSSSVLLPMPGSPPSSVTDPATMPPPSTRSSSPMPVGCGRPTRASMSSIRTGVDAVS